MSPSIRTNKIVVLENVYEPREDSYLTCKCIEYVYVTRIFTRVRGRSVRVLEIGSGTGILTIETVLEGLARNIRTHAVSIDIDYKACINTKINVYRYRIDKYVDVVCCDCDSCIKEKIELMILISNPPYLPEDETCQDKRICAGNDGRAVIDRVLECFINRNCKVLILTQSSLSDVDKTIKLLNNLKNVDVVLICKLHILFEDIVTVLAFKH